MPESDDRETFQGLSREQQWEMVRELLARKDVDRAAKLAFQEAYPAAPEAMIDTAVFHTYRDGIGAALDWLVSLALFLRDPSQEIEMGTTYHLLYHLYNWYQFNALLPEGKDGVLSQLQEIKELARDGDTERVIAALEGLEEMFGGSRDYPNFR
jgi:hypothetical protein